MIEMEFKLQRFALLINSNSETLIGGTSDDDSIFNSGNKVTITGSAGDDVITNTGDGGNVYRFGLGDGNDTIIGFNDGDSIQAFNGTCYGNKTIGNDIVYSVYGGSVTGSSITIKDGAGKSFNCVVGYYPKDAILGGTKNSTVKGTSGNDFINTWETGITIDATAGDDTIYSGWRASLSVINGGNGDDLIFVTSGYETVNAGNGNDSIIANQYIKSNRMFEFDSLGGSDVVWGYQSNDTIHITDGSILSTTKSGSDVIINVGSARMTLKDASSKTLNIRGGVRQINNTSDNQSIVGSGEADSIRNLNGNNVTIEGGDGSDTIDSWGSNVLINGGNDGDSVYVYTNSDSHTIYGGNGNDTVRDGGTRNKIFGENGNDYLYLFINASETTVDGGADDDEIYSGATNASLNGGSGNDYIHLYKQSTANTIRGGSGNDTLQSYAPSFVFEYANGDGNDIIKDTASTGTIRITDNSIYTTLNSGKDVLIPIGNGSITLKDTSIAKITGGVYGGAFDSIISNSSANTLVVGTSGRDYISLNDNKSGVTVRGAEGDDLIYGDTIGHVYQLGIGGGNDTIYGFNKNDTIQFHGNTQWRCETIGNDIFISAYDSTFLLKDAVGIDTINVMSGYKPAGIIQNQKKSTVVSGTAGNDFINNGASSVTINGDAGNDTLYNGWAASLSAVNGGAGNDLIFSASGYVTIDGGAGNDTVYTNISSSRRGRVYAFNASSGSDVVIGYNSYDTINITDGAAFSTTKSGDDVIVKVGSARMTLKDAAAQTLNIVRFINPINNAKNGVKITGTSGVDSITNSGSGVTINGGTGNDTITGSDNAELFQFAYNHGTNVITNFGINDSLQMTGGKSMTYKTVGKNVVVTIASGSTKSTVKLLNAAEFDFQQSGNVLFVKPDFNYIINKNDNSLAAGTSDDDYIINTGENVTIQPGKGNDTVEGDNDYGELFLFAYTSGNNVITNFGKNDTLRATSGALSTSASGDDMVVTIASGTKKSTVTLQGTAGHTFLQSGSYLMIDDVNYIDNNKNNMLITGTGYRDYIINNGSGVTIEGSGRNDTIETCALAEMICFAADGGQDYVTNFGKNDTLKIASGEIQSTVVLGDDLIINVKSGSYAGSITLGKAASLTSSLHSDGEYLYYDPVNYITNRTSKKKVVGTSGNDYITNSASKVTIQSGAGNDTLEGSNYGELYLFASKGGNNVITNFGKNDTLKVTSGGIKSVKQLGDDYVVSLNGGSVTLKNTGNFIFKQSGNVLTVDDINVITESDDKIKITGTTGRDLITSTGSGVTIASGKGNDTITGSDTYGELFQFAYTSGDNVITNFGVNDTLKATSGGLKYQKSGDDEIVSISSGTTVSTVTLKGAGNYAFNRNGKILTAFSVLLNEDDNVKVIGTSMADSIKNTGEGVSIQSGKGNDTITGSDNGEVFMFAYNHGSNVITNFGENDTLKATNGTLTYDKSGKNIVVSIKGATATGKVTLTNAANFEFVQSGNVLTVKNISMLENDDDKVKFVGTNDDDWMINSGENVTIEGKGGDDTIEASGNGKQLIRFGAGDGNDVILNFGKTDTLKITSGSISNYYASGSDYIIEAEKSNYSGSVTLKNVSAVKVSGTTVRATKFNTAAELPTSDYWFEEQDSAKDPLGEIINTDAAVNFDFDQLQEPFKPKLEIAGSARHHKD